VPIPHKNHTRGGPRHRYHCSIRRLKCSGFQGVAARAGLGRFERGNRHPRNSCVVSLAHQHGAGGGQPWAAQAASFSGTLPTRNLRSAMSFRYRCCRRCPFRPIGGCPCMGPRGPSLMIAASAALRVSQARGPSVASTKSVQLFASVACSRARTGLGQFRPGESCL